jgi:CRISPR-associated protein Cas1
MPVFEKPPLETLAMARDRWTPLYLEHGRIEVDDSSVKWIGSDRTVLRIPVATISALMLGPGTTITHAAIRACSQVNTPVCWVGADGVKFYAFGVTPTHDNERARKHSEFHASKQKRVEIARKMFFKRFPDTVVKENTIETLRGMEGRRVKALYEEFGVKYGVTWKGRNYDASNWELADNINKAVSAANAALYALTTAIVCSMGYLPQLGFIHSAGTLPFVFDVADMYKPELTLPAAFQAVSVREDATEEEVIALLKTRIEEGKYMHRIPQEVEELMK